MSSQTPSPKLKIASHGKRLLAFLLDFAWILLLVNTLIRWNYAEHWDLDPPTSSGSGLWSFYLSIVVIFFFKDLIKGTSPGKFIFGITTRALKDNDFQSAPAPIIGIMRNIPLIVFPIEGILLVMDSHGRRLGDRLGQTVVIENPKAHRFLIRLMAANTLFVGAFFSAFMLQPVILKKTAAYQDAIAYIQQSAEVTKKYGTIERFDAPEMGLNLQEGSGSAEIRVTTNYRDKIIGFTVHLTMVETPKRSWVPESLEIVENEG